MFDLELEAQDLGYSAEWRRQKAREYPDDRRNLEAAELLEKLAGEVRALQGSEIHRRLDAFAESYEGDLGSFSEVWSEYKRRIGFWEFPDGQSYLSDMLKAMLSHHSEKIAN
ncbi:hypothetical protein AB7M17_005252 [Bradyrhizobium sp. USDA 377]